MDFSPVRIIYGISDLIPSKPQCSLASSRRPHPLGFLPRGPLTHPPFAAAGGWRLGEHNPCYRKLLCAIGVGAGSKAGFGGGGLPCAQSSRGADCPLVAVMRAFFFITRPGSSTGMADAFVTLLAGHESRQFALSAFGTNRRPPLSLFQRTYSILKPSPPRAPPTLLAVNKNNGEALARTAVIFVFYPPGLE